MTILDVWLGFLHNFGELDDSWSYLPCSFTRYNDCWSFVITPDMMAQILSWFHISRVGRLEHFVPLTFQSTKWWYFTTCPMEPMVQILSQFHHVSFLVWRSKFLLDPMAQIFSQLCISQVGRLENLVPFSFHLEKWKSFDMCPLDPMIHDCPQWTTNIPSHFWRVGWLLVLSYL